MSMTVTVTCFGLELDVTGDYIPGEPASRYEPGEPATFEVDSIEYAGEPAPALLDSAALCETIAEEAARVAGEDADREDGEERAERAAIWGDK